MIKLIGIIFILICMSSIFVNYINNDEELAYKVNNLFFFLEYEIEDVGQAARGGATVDFNNDSRIDFAVSFADEPFNQSIISIFYNNIKKFVRRDIFQFNYTYINDINTGDFDNDGDIDIIYTYNEWKIIDSFSTILGLNGVG